MSIFSGLPNPAAPALAFQHGLRQGQADREEREVRGALSAYAINPDDPAAFERLAQWRPEVALQVRQEQEGRRQAAQLAELQRRAASGDQSALAEMAGIDLDAWDKISDNDRARVKESVDAVGQAALRISQLPEAERPAAWDAAVDQLSTRFPDVAQYRGQYSPEALASAIDQAKLVTQFFELERPNYTVVPRDADLVNERDPEAIRQFIEGRSAALPTIANPDEARALPPGTEFRTPDGRIMRVPGGGGSNATGTFRP